MRTTRMRWATTLAWGITAVWCVTPLLNAASLLIYEADVRDLEVGATVTVPVAISEMNSETLAAFQFEFEYRDDVLDFSGIEHGPLIMMTNADRAVPEYSPNLWGLAARAEDGRITAAGCILLAGVHVDQENLGDLADVRPTADSGVLFSLKFNLLQKVATPISCVALRDYAGIVLDDALAPDSTPLVAAPATVTAGGLIVAGLPNWWQLARFGQLGVDPAGDPDRDGVSNEGEYRRGSNPVLVEGLPVELDSGWNLVSLPLQVEQPQVQAVFAGAGGGVLHYGTVWQWVATREGGRYEPATSLAAQVGYWVYRAGERVAVSVDGLFPAGVVGLNPGWNVVGTLRERPPPVGVGSFWWWNPGVGAFRVVNSTAGETLKPGRAYWLHASSSGTLDLGL